MNDLLETTLSMYMQENQTCKYDEFIDILSERGFFHDIDGGTVAGLVCDAPTWPNKSPDYNKRYDHLTDLAESGRLYSKTHTAPTRAILEEHKEYLDLLNNANKVEKRGGKRENARRPTIYDEPYVRKTYQIPESKFSEIDIAINEILNKYKKGN